MYQYIKCPHCGRQHKSGAKYCPTTGNLLQAQQLPVQTGGAKQTGRLPPQFILQNRYIILRKVGEGGMAAVYQAADSALPNVNWAVKEMSDAKLRTPEDQAYALASFQQEARLLSNLSHANLPRVVDFFSNNLKHYLVMEFIYGRTLEKVFNDQGRLFSEAEVLPWALQLCDVLAYLHSQNPPIIFRDIKPSNIMLTPHGQVKLIDFGVVRFFKPGKTKDTQAIGTPGYTAPEAHGGQTDGRSDTYSLCVMLHQMLTGHDPEPVPWSIPPARQLNPSISMQMEQILTKGMQLNRDHRWQSAMELKKALQRLQSTSYPQPPAGARPPGQQKATQTSRPTTRLLMAAVELSPQQLGAILVGSVVGLMVVTWLSAPYLARMPVDWNNLPIIAIFGALGYAAYPRRGAAFTAHSLLTIALVATVWTRLGGGWGYTKLFVAAAVSGALMEAWVALLPWVKKQRPGDGWWLEVGWLAFMEVIGVALFFGLLTDWYSGASPVQWLFAALLGAGGWFLGDLIQKYSVYRKTGIWPSD